jgi:hypothetical protein
MHAELAVLSVIACLRIRMVPGWQSDQNVWAAPMTGRDANLPCRINGKCAQSPRSEARRTPCRLGA